MRSSILLPLHEAAGARLTDGPTGPELLTGGDVPAEYRAATQGCALFDRTDLGLVLVRGEDRSSFLHRILANEVRALEPGQGNRNLLLSSKGKVLFDLDLAVEEDAVRLAAPPGRAAALVSELDKYLFSEKVALEDASAASAPLELCGPKAGAVLAALLGREPPRAGHAHLRGSFGGAPLLAQALPVAGAAGFRLDAGPEAAVALWEALRGAGAHPAGRVVRDSLRVERGAAEWGQDLDGEIYPQEARLEPGFSLSKGCYVGQEVVAKIDTYGGLNKRLSALVVSDDDQVARGTRLWRLDEGEWRDLGVVTSWAWSFALDRGAVLAYLKRRHQEPGTAFRIGEGPREALVAELPLAPGAGAR